MMRPDVWGFMTRWWKQLITLIVLLAGLGVATWQLLESDTNQQEHSRNLFRNGAIEVADKLKRQIETSVSSLYAMASMIEVDGGKFLEQHFTPVAETVLTKYKGITNFDIAPFAVVKTKVPAKGNEGAIGHAMLSDPNRIQATVDTIRKQKAILDGPIRLKETGGIGIIARYPVFTAFSPEVIPDIRSWWPDWSHNCCNTSMPLTGHRAESFPGPVKNGNQTYFYGLVEFVSKLPNLTADLNVPSIEKRMIFQIRNTKPHKSMSDSPVFFNSPSIKADTILDDPETVPISIPDVDIEWEFLAVPKDGWPSHSIVNIILIAGIWGGLVATGLAYFLVQQVLYLSVSSKLLQAELQRQCDEINEKALASVEELAAPMVLISAELFLKLGRLTSYEELRNTGKVISLDTLAQVQLFRQTRWIIFFSHQWLGYSFPDKEALHYHTMCDAIPSVIAAMPCKSNAPDVSTTFIWVDYGSISQVNSSVQALCIDSLPLLASEADAFVMVVPDTEHTSTSLPCNYETYSQRGWCRAEILCNVCASGTSNMYVARGDSDLETLSMERFKQLSMSVFEGNFTCCALGHPNGSICDKQKLKSPILGVYYNLKNDLEGGVAGKAQYSSKAEVFEYLTEHMDVFFPHSTVYTSVKDGKHVSQREDLFGVVVRTSSQETVGRWKSLKSSESNGNALQHAADVSPNIGIPFNCPIQLQDNAFGAPFKIHL